MTLKTGQRRVSFLAKMYTPNTAFRNNTTNSVTIQSCRFTRANSFKYRLFRGRYSCTLMHTQIALSRSGLCTHKIANNPLSRSQPDNHGWTDSLVDRCSENRARSSIVKVTVNVSSTILVRQRILSQNGLKIKDERQSPNVFRFGFKPHGKWWDCDKISPQISDCRTGTVL